MGNVRRLISWVLVFIVGWMGLGADSWAADYKARTDEGGYIIGYEPVPSSSLPDGTESRPVSGRRARQSAEMAQPLQSAPSMQQQRFPSEQPKVYDYTTWFVGKGPYTLGRDDVIRIQVRNQGEFSGDFVIGPDGKIQYNYMGDIYVADLTKEELQEILTKLLEQFIRVPQVVVHILAYNSKVVYVLGEVNRPGKYIMRGDTIKLREAIIAAGLPTFFALTGATHVVKPDLTRPKVRKINLARILYEGKLKEDIDIYPGEIIVVPSTVLSKVNRFLSALLSPVSSAQTARSLSGI